MSKKNHREYRESGIMVGDKGWFWILIILLLVTTVLMDWLADVHPEIFSYLHLI